jgi:uncharacterized protein (TIGR03032 family)
LIERSAETETFHLTFGRGLERGTLTMLRVAPSFADWLGTHGASIAFTTYQPGFLFLVGASSEGRLAVAMQNFDLTTGVAYAGGRLFLAARFQLWRLEPVDTTLTRLAPVVDAAFMPRHTHVIGATDPHDLAVDRAGRAIFVNTRFNCLAVPGVTGNFRPIWKPPFISAIVPEDRCHLNGLALRDGVPAYVTAVGQANTKDAWRDSRRDGGVAIDLATDRIVVDGLSMPHSPQVWDGAVWVLESGRGFLVRVDPETGCKQDVAFCPGFARGLAFHDGFAVVLTSRLRRDSFAGLELTEALEARGQEAQCAILVIDPGTGEIVTRMELTGGRITETFGVAVLPGLRCPTLLAGRDLDSHGLVTIEAAPAKAQRKAG